MNEMVTNNNSLTSASEEQLIIDVRQIIESGRSAAYGAVNAAMVDTYWKIGRRIVEQEQNGAGRAEYGTHVLQILAAQLSQEFGKGFDERRLRDYRQFFLYFNDLENWHSRVPNLSWTHFRTLLRVTDEAARNWYLNEASTQQWSVRTLDRNISSQYYHRLLQSQNRGPVEQEMKQLTKDFQNDITRESNGVKTNEARIDPTKLPRR